MMIADPQKVKKILFLESGSGYGGSSKCLFLFLKYLDRKKYFPLVLYYNLGPNIEAIQNIEICAQKYSIAALFSNIRKSDLVYTNNEIYSHFFNIILAKVFGKKCICHIRGMRPLTRGEKIVSKLANKFIAVSNICKKNLIREGLPEAKIDVVYDGIELGNAGFLKSENKKLRIGAVGRISKGKGQEVFVEAAKTLLSKNQNIKFFIIGDDVLEGKPVLNHLKSLVKGYELEEHVYFTGWKTDVKEIYGNLDIVVCPSILNEALGNAVIEAMMFSKPIIASNTGAYPEMIQDNEEGLLFKVGDAADLAQKIDILLKNEPLRIRLGQQASRMAKEKFNIECTVYEIERIIHEEFATASFR
jgi:glycosyltransferase involved in cell wall biosynthesis